MRITSLTVKNFKGIDERGATIDFAPITLLFGPNNAGKSTFIHALHLAREVFCNENFNPEIPEFCSASVDLGGFQNFVHKHDLNRTVSLGITFSIGNDCFPSFENILAIGAPGKSYYKQVQELTNNIKQCTVEMGIRWNSSEQRAEPAYYQVSLNGKPLTKLRFTSGSAEIYMQRLTGLGELIIPEDKLPGLYKLAEKMWKLVEKNEDYSNEAIDHLDAVDEYARLYCLYPIADYSDLITYANGSDQIPEIVGRSRDEVELLVPGNGFINFDSALDVPGGSLDGGGEIEGVDQEALTMYFMSALVVGPGTLLRDWLCEGVRHLGPLRDIPPRTYRAPTTPSRNWSNGAAAWDTLALADPEQLAHVNHWLDGEHSLGIGYTVAQRHILPLDAASPVAVALRKAIQEEVFEDREISLVRELFQHPAEVRLALRSSRTGTAVAPCDMGTGISQVIPVVTAACMPSFGTLVAVEQPELHIHPKLQVALGDLFISALQKEKNFAKEPTFLIETHSEHLLLRLLKRVRQTEMEKESKFFLMREQLAVWYIQDSQDGPIVHQLRVDEEGDFLDRWPDGFFDERAKELFE